MKKKLAVIICFLMTLALTACGQSSSSGEKATEDAAKTEVSAENQELTKFSVVLDWYPNAIHAFLYDAIEKGYFAEEGLDVELVSPADSVDAITFVAAERAQIGLSYPIDVVTAYANEDMPVRAIGAIAQEALGCMASLASTDITEDMASLAGKKIGYSGTGAAKAQIDTITKNAGLTADDFELVNVGFDLVTSLTTQSTDLVVGTFINDEIITMRNAGYDVNVWRYQDYGVPAMYGLIMVCNDDAYQENAALYEGFLRACAKGFQDIQEDSELAMDLIMNQMNSADNPLDEEQQRQSYETLIPLMETEDGSFLSMVPEKWQDTIDWMAESELISEKISAEDIITCPKVSQN